MCSGSPSIIIPTWSHMHEQQEKTLYHWGNQHLPHKDRLVIEAGTRINGHYDYDDANTFSNKAMATGIGLRHGTMNNSIIQVNLQSWNVKKMHACISSTAFCTFLHLWFHPDRQPKRDASMHKLLCTNQASLKVLQNTVWEEKHFLRCHVIF